MALKRKNLPECRKWATEDIFPDRAAFEKTYAEVEGEIDFSSYVGALSDPDKLFECLEKINRVGLRLSHLGVYAFMKHDEDTRDSESVALRSRCDTLDMKFGAAIAFVTPELSALPTERLKAFAADPRFSDYDYTLRDIIRRKPHILPAETEALLARGSRVFGGYRNVFSMIDNADFPFPTVKVDGKPVKVTHGMYGVLLKSSDRNLRRATFRSYYRAYQRLLNTITASYVGSVDKDVFLARARKYSSAMEMALSEEDVDIRVYRNLLDAVHCNLPALHRYFRDKKRALGVSRLHMYDVYTPTVEGAELSLDYEDAFALVKQGLAPLGERYAALLQEAHDCRWIDVEETEGKRSGAYSISVYGLKHPYVLLNYQPSTGAVFTLAHELGHAMHSYHSERNQPQEKADYKIFVAEVASTVNEVLLIRHLLATSEDKKLRKYLLSYYIEMIKSTLFRQTQFAEFEYIAHEMAENGTPLTTDALNKVYLDLNRAYYGRSVVSDPEIAWEWARIPHFYRAFYVYKYATGIISAVSIAERILSQGQSAVEDYFRFLSSGGSDSPVELLKLAGVDLTKKDAFDLAMRSFKNALEQFEAIED